MNNLNYKELWEEICFLLFDNVSSNITEKDFESNVIRSIEKLGWREFKKEIKRQPIIPIGRQGSLRPDVAIYNSTGEAVIVIEIKRPTEDISKDDSINQLKSYMRQLKSDFGLLIGKEIRIYYDGNLNPQPEPLLVDKISYDKTSQKGIKFSEIFHKDNFILNLHEDFLKEKISKFNKQREIEKLTKIITSNTMKDKIIDFLKNELTDFSDDVFMAAIDNLKIQIIPKKFETNLSQIQESPTKPLNKPQITKGSSLSKKQYSIEELSNEKLDKNSRPKSIIINGNESPVRNWTELVKIFINYLIEHKILKESDLPILNHAGRDKYFVNSQKQHKDPLKNGQWLTIGNFCIDTKYNAEHHKRNVIHILDVLNIKDLEISINF